MFSCYRVGLGLWISVRVMEQWPGCRIASELYIATLLWSDGILVEGCEVVQEQVSGVVVRVCSL